MPADPALILTILDMAVEIDRIGDLRSFELPGIAMSQPVLGVFDLPSLVETLLEQAEFVADAVAGAGDPQGCHAVEEAGRKPAQPAIAQRRVGFDLDHPVEIDVEIAQRRAACLDNAQIGQSIAEQPANQELHR